jgi:hypothetical protein
MIDYISPEYNSALEESTVMEINKFLEESNMTDILVKVCQRFIFRMVALIILGLTTNQISKRLVAIILLSSKEKKNIF